MGRALPKNCAGHGMPCPYRNNEKRFLARRSGLGMTVGWFARN